MQKSIVIDATHYHMSSATGVENYVDQILPDLSTILIKKGWQVSWISHLKQASTGVPAGVDWIYSTHTSFWSQRTLHSVLKKMRPTMFFAPSGLYPVSYKGKTIVSVFDLGAYIFPEAYSFGQQIRNRLIAQRNARHATKIISVSEYTKQQIIKYWDIKADRIKVIPLAYQKPNLDPEEVRGINAEVPIILYVGRIETKKNLTSIVKAFSHLRPGSAQLILAGKNGKLGSEDIQQLAGSYSSESSSTITFTGYISERQKAWLYQNAKVCLVPGMAEGFGLPVLEAFSYGVPVICARAGSLTEVGGDSVLYVDPQNDLQWAEKIEKILTDPVSSIHLIDESYKKLQEYSWQTTIQLTSELIQELG